MELVSIIIVTKRNNINKIIDNYIRQSYLNKELIIIINSLSINKKHFINELKKNDIENYKIYQNNDKITLGECYNYAINEFNGDYFCKMDDDDFYDSNYIVNQLFFLKKWDIDIIGKSYFYLYDSYNKILYSKYIPSIILGGTMIIKKNVFDKINFDKLNRGEDTNFLRKAYLNNFKIQSSKIDDFVYIRYTNNNNHHTYNVNIQNILGKNFNIVNDDKLKEKINLFLSC